MSDSRAATRAYLEQLWELVAQELIAHFRETPRGHVTAEFFDVARAFLKQNNLTIDQLSDPQAGLQTLQQLSDLSLPFTGSVSPRLRVGPSTGAAESTTEEPDE